MMGQVTTRFKPPRTPNKPKKESAASKRPGMDPKHVSDVGKLPSCISGRKPCDPHHLKIKKERGVGLKATDRWCVPLTREEHDDVQPRNQTQELAWFKKRGIDPYALANALWFNKGDIKTMQKVVETHLNMAGRGYTP